MSVQPHAATNADRLRARRGVLLFLVLITAFDVVFTIVIAATGNLWLIWALMWSVAVSSIICRLILREGIRDVSFRLGGIRTLAFVAAAFVFPLVVGFIAYGIAWTTGLATFTSPPRGFPTQLLLAATIGAAVSAVSAAGEEIGWRGYVLTRLVDAGVPCPVLVSGVVWGLWHVPLIVAGIYVADPSRSPLLTVPLFMVSVTSFGFLIGYVRLATGSIWPCIALHAAWNSIIQGAFDLSTTGADAALWTGEAGILVVLTLVVAAVLVSVRPWRMLRSPGDPMVAGAGA
jgi:uncharacterized protein